jgi:hypothetical protein
MSIDCDDKEAETLAKRVPAYLISLGVIDVKVVEIESLQLEGSRK